MNCRQVCQYMDIHEQLGPDAPFVYWMGEVINVADWEPREEPCVCPKPKVEPVLPGPEVPEPRQTK